MYLLMSEITYSNTTKKDIQNPQNPKSAKVFPYSLPLTLKRFYDFLVRALQWSWVQNHQVVPGSTQPFTLAGVNFGNCSTLFIKNFANTITTFVWGNIIRRVSTDLLAWKIMTISRTSRLIYPFTSQSRKMVKISKVCLTILRHCEVKS